MEIIFYHKLYKSMDIVIIFLILLNFCSGDTSYFFDDSGRTNICYKPSPCKFKITKEFPISPKIPSKYIYHEYNESSDNFYGYYFNFDYPEHDYQESFYIEVYDASNGENIMKNSDCFLVWMIYEIGGGYQGYPNFHFDFANSLDNIDFIDLDFLGQQMVFQ